MVTESREERQMCQARLGRKFFVDCPALVLRGQQQPKLLPPNGGWRRAAMCGWARPCVQGGL